MVQILRFLICSPLQMNFLNLLSKFRGYIFNGLEEEIMNLKAEKLMEIEGSKN